MRTKSWSLRRSQRKLMGCKGILFVLKMVSHILTQVSLGLLPAGNIKTMSSPECATYSQRIAPNVG